MDRGGTDFASRRRTLDTPEKPESGLAEWTSKIREMQRQVDADEEEETKRLEQEIAASRLARMRRSTGRGTSADLSNTDVAAALKEPTTAAFDSPRSADERRHNQDDALKKLSNDGANSGLADYNSYITSKNMKASPGAPMSLAAFMGGKASGPRLNKHAPQQDAHDPTQFEQRKITSPHPIFGRGGVAMPGMVSRARGPVSQSRAETTSPRAPEAHVQNHTPLPDTFKAKSDADKVDSHRPVGVTQFGVARSDPPRQRTFSTPTGPAVSTTSRTSYSPSFNNHKPEQSSPKPLSHSPSPVLRSSSRPNTPKDQSSPATNHVFPARSNTVSPYPRSPVIRSPSPPKTPILSSPGLAKPIQPSPRKSLQGPQVPISPNPSAAYLRPPPAKEPTPSISRLQGRGFVQSMVRASSRMDTGSNSGSPSAADKSKELAKKASVLDRWHHGSDAAPVIAPKPIPLRKSRTTDSASQPNSVSSTPVQIFPTYKPSSPKPERAEFSNMTVRSRASLPSISQERYSPPRKSDEIESPTPSQRRALGSSTTMVSYIKPIKTGDGPSVASPPSRPPSSASRGRTTTPGVDELGVRVRSRTRSIGEDTEKRSGTPGSGAGGKPLNHPTKARPHKPRKAKTLLTGSQSPSTAQTHVDRAKTDDQAITPASTIEEASPGLPQNIKPLDVPRSLLDEDKFSSISESPPTTPGASRRVHFPLAVDVPTPPPPHHTENSPSTPIRHSRIPSTGNRATVMDVAQVFNEHKEHAYVEPSDTSPPTPQTQSSLPAEEEDNPAPRPDVKSMIANWGPHNDNGSAPHGAADKRKSSYEKYSAFTLPPLVEEKTPVPSPAGTLTRNAIPPSIDTVLEEELPAPLPASQDATLSVSSEKPVKNAVVDAYVHLDIVDEPLPTIDVDALLIEGHAYTPDPDIQTISVEVLSIMGASAVSVDHDTNVFYNNEILAVVHRCKAKSSGLVNTKVWSWLGAKSKLGEKEERKLNELARRYNTSLITVEQYAEPPELVHLLGGQLATRQGTRTHWTTENTAMHMVRSVENLIYIDELPELSIRNLCSGFSYCISLLETFYVWHGRGATAQERQAASTYAQALAPTPTSVIELSEEAGDDDEMFWIILGEGDYGKADYWRWKPSSESRRPRIWLVDSTADGGIIIPAATFKQISAVHSHVCIVDCLWEYFVLVGPEARGQRKEIRLALDVATKMANKLAPTLPYAPTVHALVLPSQLPIDLRLAFRDLDESYLNQGNVPEHMNLLTVEDAFEHLGRSSWERSLLKDSTMLPLGLAAVQ